MHHGVTPNDYAHRTISISRAKALELDSSFSGRNHRCNALDFAVFTESLILYFKSASPLVFDENGETNPRSNNNS
jgi:hypothetical protein